MSLETIDLMRLGRKFNLRNITTVTTKHEEIADHLISDFEQQGDKFYSLRDLNNQLKIELNTEEYYAEIAAQEDCRSLFAS